MTDSIEGQERRGSIIVRRLVVRITLVGALVLAGCSTADDGEQRAEVPDPVNSILADLDPSEPVSPTDIDPAVIDELVRPVPEPTPLEAFFELMTGPEKSPAQYEDELAVCMKLQGFEYVPWAPAQPELVGQLSDMQVMSALLGYGISTLWGREPMSVPAGGVDPNEEIYGSLSNEERAAYDVVSGDCQVEVGLSATEEEIERRQAVSDELAALLIGVEQRINAHPDMVAAQEGWRRCMADAGFDYRDRQEILAELSQAAEVISRQAPVLPGQALLEDLPADLRQQLADLQTRERTIAQADLRCRADLDQTLYETRVAVEQDAIDNDPQLIDRLTLLLADSDNQP